MVAAFLTKYYGQGDGQTVSEPAHTLTTRDRLGVVTVDIDGTTYAITDIGMRMLTPREQFRAQGFPDSYNIETGADGKPMPKTQQTHKCGNSVCPPVAAALVSANCGHLNVPSDGPIPRSSGHSCKQGALTNSNTLPSQGITSDRNTTGEAPK